MMKLTSLFRHFTLEFDKGLLLSSVLHYFGIEMPSDIVTSFPAYFCRGEVVKGFGRGSKELGIPTGEFMLNVRKTESRREPFHANQFVFMLVYVKIKFGKFLKRVKSFSCYRTWIFHYSISSEAFRHYLWKAKSFNP